MAIGIDSEGKASVQTEGSSKGFEDDDAEHEAHQDTISLFRELPRIGVLKEPTELALGRTHSELDQYLKSSPSLPNHLARNILMGVGIRATMSRRGDTNCRWDLLLECNDELGVAEVEFAQDILDQPRNLLDDIATLCARFGREKDRTFCAVIALSLPNQRSDYWQVIKDIESILGIQIYTLTVGALLTLLWCGIELDLEQIESFAIDSDCQSIRGPLEEIVGSLSLSDGYLGIMEPQK